jgi:hypothetical protein
VSAGQFPLPLVYEGQGLFRAPKGHVRRADAQFGTGEYVVMAPVEERSPAAHRAYFAAVNECWRSLPEALAAEHPTADALRKHALIATGWRDQETHVCASKAEAIRTAALIKRYVAADAWPVITVANCVVVVLTAKSQSVRAMPKAEFERSSRDVLAYLASALGVEAGAVPSHEAA